jgi:hypothetical protein
VQHKQDLQSSDSDDYESLNLKFNTNIFTQNCSYIIELGHIYAAKALIDSALSEIMPNLLMQPKIAASVKKFMEAVDDLKVATKKCATDMEDQRK